MKVTFKHWRTLNIALRNNPACFQITGEDTEEWREAIAVFKHAWQAAHVREHNSRICGTIVSMNGQYHSALSVDFNEVVLISETPPS